MPVTEKYSISAVQLDDTDDVIIGGITQSSFATGLTVSGEPTSGEPYPRIQTINAIEPLPTFTSYMIATLLSNIGVAGLDISGLASGVALYLYKHASGSTRAAGSVHRKALGAAGMVIPQTLSVDNKGDCTLQCQVMFLSADGSAAAYAVTDANAMVTLTDAERFALGTAKVGDITLGQLTNLSIDFGLNVVAEAAGGEVYPTFASIETWLPVITLRGNKVSNAAGDGISLTGTAATHANTILFLRKRASGGTFVADNVAEHIKFTVAGLATVDPLWDGSGSTGAEIGIKVEMKYDGTNNPITVDTAIAIT